MIYRPLGATGLKVSAIAFGASPLGGAYQPIDEAECLRAVHAAVDLGLNFIDVSPYYGDTRAERVLGQSLRGIPREKYILGTKVGRYGLANFDFSAARVTRSIDESLARMGVDNLDLIQCHDIEFVDLKQIVEETLPALRKAVAAGKARFVGITGLPLKIFPAIIDRVPVDAILSYCHYALNDTSLAGLLPYLQQRKIGVINAAPFSMGLLTKKGVPPWHPAPAAFRETCARAAAYCQSKGVDIEKLAVQFSVANEAIASTFVGMATVNEVTQNVRWAAEPPDQQLVADVQRILAPILNQTWPSGKPENN